MQGVVSTNALKLRIDLGSLDAAAMRASRCAKKGLQTVVFAPSRRLGNGG